MVFDELIRGPLFASLLMCFSSSIIGVFFFVQKKSLLSESLSHASFPGSAVSVILSILMFDKVSSIMVFSGSVLFSVLGYYLIKLMNNKFNVSTDAALCFILSSMFSIGLLILSYLQYFNEQGLIYLKSLLYGQVATLMDYHIWMYLFFAVFILIVIFAFFKQFELIVFDKLYAKNAKINAKLLEFVLFMFLVFSIVMGMKSVGIILMIGMLIAPAAAARQFTNKLSFMVFLSAFFGSFSAITGHYLSYYLTEYVYQYKKVSFATGPFIVLIASLICILSLLFAPKRGIVFRVIRRFIFSVNCAEENILKNMIKIDIKGLSFNEIKNFLPYSNAFIFLLIKHLQKRNLIIKKSKSHFLTKLGRKKASRILHLHYLWEIYLEQYIGGKGEKIHRNAEEMEHIINKDLEKKLKQMLIERNESFI